MKKNWFQAFAFKFNLYRYIVVGRRGVAQGAFSPKELRELLSLPGVRVTAGLHKLNSVVVML